ncbi:MAG: protein kinase, partial [Planctomycetes bacterium]|nr:protein kinase [Planctomycetota bacterium]
SLLRDVALAVQHAHSAGIIHRDLKPANVLVDGRKQPHVTDFGLAKLTHEKADLSLTNSGQIMGTPSYMSPEQAKGKKSIDRRTDIYALGVMLYEVLTGRPPFTGQSPIEVLMKVVYDPVPRPSTVLGGSHPAVDATIENICLKALAKNPGSRYATAKAFADDLSRWLKGEQLNVVVPKFDPRLRWVWAGAAAGLVFLAALYFLLSSSTPADRDFARGERFMNEQLYEDAFAAYDRALKRKPDHYRASEGKFEANRRIIAGIEAEGERLAKAGKYTEALTQYRLALARNPANVRVQQKLSVAMAAARDAAAKTTTGTEREKLERQIRAAEEAEREARKASPPPPPAGIPADADYSGRPEVEYLPGEPRGIRLLTTDEGPYEIVTHAGRSCVRALPNAAGVSRLIFDLDDRWAAPALMVELEVECFDASPAGLFGVAYDSMDDALEYSGKYKSGGEATLGRTDSWRVWKFLLTVPRFENRQNGGADFRVQPGRGGFYLSRIRLHRLESPPDSPRLKAVPIPLAPLQPGLQGEVFADSELRKSVSSRIYRDVSFQWREGTGPDGLAGNFSVRWSGYLQVPVRSVHLIETLSDDGVRVFVDDVPLISNWTLHAPAVDSALCDLEAGVHSLRIEYFQASKGAAIRFACFSAGGDSRMHPLPLERLLHLPAPDARASGPVGTEGRPLAAVWKSLLDHKDRVIGQTITLRKPGLGEAAHVVRNVTESQLLLDMRIGGGSAAAVETPESLPTAVLLVLLRMAEPRPKPELVRSTAALLAERGEFDAAYRELDRIKSVPAEYQEAIRALLVAEREKADALKTPFEKAAALKKLSRTRSALLPDDARKSLEAEISELTAAPPPAAGFLLREFWLGIPGRDLAELRRDPRFPDKPSGSSYPTAFEAPVDWGDKYGTLMRGYVHPPATGSYVFWIAGDDMSELWLSSDDKPENKVKLATVLDFSLPREWSKTPAQQSAPIVLSAGRRYYVEAIHKEGSGGDHVAVGWQLPDGTMERPIPGSRLSPFGKVPAVNPSGGLVGLWKLDEGAGLVAADASGQGHAGKLIGGVAWNPGKRGIHLDGASGYVELPNSPVLNRLQEGSYSLAAWFRPESTPPATGNADRSYAILMKLGWHEGLEFDQANKFVMTHYLAGNECHNLGWGTQSPPGRWYHVAGVVDKSTGSLSIFINGRPADSKPFPAETPARDYGTQNWRIGVAGPSSDFSWFARGDVDSVRLYSRALGPAEVEALHRSESAAHEK